MEQLAHKLLVGDAAEIRRLARRRQKNDRRDADLLLELLVRNEFPALFRYSRESRELLRQLRYRHKLVKLRTMVVNTLHALAINDGLSLRTKLLTKGGRRQLSSLQLSHISQQQRDELLSLADEADGFRRWSSGCKPKLKAMLEYSDCKRTQVWVC